MIKKIIANKYIKLSVILVIVLGVGLTAYKMVTKAQESSSEVPTIKEEAVTRGDITIGFTGDGEAEIPVVNLDFELSGKLAEIYVSEGDVIKQGQILAKLDDTEYQNQLKTAQISYDKALINLAQTEENARLNLIKEKQSLDDARLKLEQVEAEYLPMLDLPEVYSKQEIQLKRIAYDSAKSAYEVQLERYNVLKDSNTDITLENANVESSRINLETAKNNLENTILKSPIDATVLNISYKPGETVSTVKESGTVTADTSHFMVVSDSDKVEVVVPVSETDLANVQMDQTVEVVFEAYEGQTFSGKVISIASLPRVDNSGLVTYDVRIELEKGLEKIKTGMTCSVDFILRQQKNVLIIPNKAVSMVEGKQVVKVKDQNGNILTKNIKTGLTDGKNVEVTEGLDVGETVLIESTK
ncbi:MAG: efflux RND transporter periplasmic adaptor subunit [Bacillota bacterium]